MRLDVGGMMLGAGGVVGASNNRTWGGGGGAAAEQRLVQVFQSKNTRHTTYLSIYLFIYMMYNLYVCVYVYAYRFWRRIGYLRRHFRTTAESLKVIYCKRSKQASVSLGRESKWISVCACVRG